MRKFVDDEGGIAAVEFAMIALPMLMLIMGSLEMGIQMFQKARAESVLRDAARMSVTGDLSRIGTNGSEIDEYVKAELALTPSTQVDIERYFYDDFSKVRQPEKRLSNATEAPYCFIDTNGNQQWDEDPVREGAGGAEDIIDYRVTVTYDALFPLITNVLTGQKEMSVGARTTLRNEPFSGTNDLESQNCCISAEPGNPVTCEA